MWIKTADLDASSGPAVFISFSVTTKINKKMDEILSKHGGVSYYKYSDYKLIRNCAFESRTEALLDSDDDGIYDIHEQGGIALPSGKIIYTNPCDEDTDHDHLLDNKEIYVTYGEIKDGKVPVKCYYVSDPSDPDTDGDRLSDYDESIDGTIMTNPLDLDSDDDEFFDGLEIYNGFNPQLPDADKDGRLDYQEYCEDTNPYVYDKNNWEYAWDFCCGFLAGDIIPEVESIPMLVGQILGSFVPLSDARDVLGNLMNDNPEMAMLSAVGLIPVGGDAIKAIAKFAEFMAKHAHETMLSAELLIQISNKSDTVAKIIGHSDEAKRLKLAIANGANDNITRPMVDKINDIVDSADKIEFKPKATLMDDVGENLNKRFDKLLNSDYYRTARGFDCSEIAKEFYDEAGKKGKIYRIEGKNGIVYQYEYGEKLEFYYHEVYCDGKFIYDPRYTNVPVDKNLYFSKLREINPDGFEVFEKCLED